MTKWTRGQTSRSKPSNFSSLKKAGGDVNIITSDDVKGTVTIRMKDTPWDQALDVILRQKQLGSVREGNIIRVAPQAVPQVGPQVAEAPCNCLTKQNLPDGSVLFQDICTKESAIAPPQSVGAR